MAYFSLIIKGSLYNVFADSKVFLYSLEIRVRQWDEGGGGVLFPLFLELK